MLFPYFIFHQIDFLNIHKKYVSFVLSFNFLIVCLLQSQHKRGMAVYKIFNSNDFKIKSFTFATFFT